MDFTDFRIAIANDQPLEDGSYQATLQGIEKRDTRYGEDRLMWDCPVSTDCLPLRHGTSSHSSFLVLSGAEMSQCGMPSVGVVEALDVLEDRSPGALAVRP